MQLRLAPRREHDHGDGVAALLVVAGVADPQRPVGAHGEVLGVVRVDLRRPALDDRAGSGVEPVQLHPAAAVGHRPEAVADHRQPGQLDQPRIVDGAARRRVGRSGRHRRHWSERDRERGESGGKTQLPEPSGPDPLRPRRRHRRTAAPPRPARHRPGRAAACRPGVLLGEHLALARAPARPARPRCRAAAARRRPPAAAAARRSGRAAARCRRRGGRRRTPRRAAGGADGPAAGRPRRRILLTTSSSCGIGRRAPRRSRRAPARTALIWSSGSGSEASTTCTQQVRARRLLQRRAERLDELVRQVPDEPDGVGERVRRGRPR